MGVVLFALFVEATLTTAAAEEQSESYSSAPSPSPSPSPAPPLAPPPPPPIEVPRRYGDGGTSEIALGLGYSSDSGLLIAGALRYFVWDAVAPGIETTYVAGGSSVSRYGLILAALRLVPSRSEHFALVLTGRAGRVLMADHVDGWGVGGEAGVIVFLGTGGSVGLEIGYEVLRLLPASFCADLSSCVLQGPVLGLRLTL